MENPTLFIVSDIHGFYDPLITALDKAGFSMENPRHILVCLGDYFDRGDQNDKVLDYFLKVKNKVLIKGNHDYRLEELLNGNDLEPYDEHNGTYDTLAQLFGYSNLLNYRLVAPDDHPNKIKCRCLLDQMVNYYEWGDFIFTHGWLPVDNSTPPVVKENWREASQAEWKRACWLEWQQCYTRLEIPQGKTLVVGHRSASLAHQYNRNRFSDDYSIFFGDRLIVMDSCTVRSGVVNVLKINKNGIMKD